MGTRWVLIARETVIFAMLLVEQFPVWKEGFREGFQKRRGKTDARTRATIVKFLTHLNFDRSNHVQMTQHGAYGIVEQTNKLEVLSFCRSLIKKEKSEQEKRIDGKAAIAFKCLGILANHFVHFVIFERKTCCFRRPAEYVYSTSSQLC